MGGGYEPPVPGPANPVPAEVHHPQRGALPCTAPAPESPRGPGLALPEHEVPSPPGNASTEGGAPAQALGQRPRSARPWARWRGRRAGRLIQATALLWGTSLTWVCSAHLPPHKSPSLGFLHSASCLDCQGLERFLGLS